MAYAITIKNLCKYYGDLLAVDNLSPKIKKGDFVGLLGPNGAGKSTTIKILCGIMRPSSGSARINGVDVSNRVKALSDVGVIVEIPEFYPCFTSVDALTYLGRIRQMDSEELVERIEMVLELVGLEDRADTKIGEFSRGMKQRLGVAQVLLHDPSILILDEPAMGLDPEGIAEVREIIKKAKGEKTVFFASHILAEVKKICEKVAVINKGRLVAYNDIGKLEEEAFGRLKIEVKTVKPPTKKQLGRIRRLKDVFKVKQGNRKLIIDFKGDQEASADLLDNIINIGVKVTSFTPSPEMLEELYIRLVEAES